MFVSSLAGLQPGSRLPAYDASKAGLLGLSRHVAMEGARRASGPTCGPGADRHPLGRVATRGRRPGAGPTSRSAARARLGGGLGHVLPAVGRGGYITGQVLAVDGGLSLVDRQRPTSGDLGPEHPELVVESSCVRLRSVTWIWSTPNPASTRRNPAICSGEPWTARPMSQRGSPTYSGPDRKRRR